MSRPKAVTFFALLLGLVGCGGGGEFIPPPPKTTSQPISLPQLVSITVPVTSGTMVPGSSGSLPVTAHFSNDSAQDITSVTTWQSSDQGVVTVDATGKIASVSIGNATVTATYLPSESQGTAKSVSIAIEVVASGLQTIEVTGSVPRCLPIGPLNPVQLNAVGHFTDGSSSQLSAVEWTSSAPGLVTVSTTGVLQGVTPTFFPVSVTISARKELVTGTRNVNSASPLCNVP